MNFINKKAAILALIAMCVRVESVEGCDVPAGVGNDPIQGAVAHPSQLGPAASSYIFSRTLLKGETEALNPRVESGKRSPEAEVVPSSLEVQDAAPVPSEGDKVEGAENVTTGSEASAIQNPAEPTPDAQGIGTEPAKTNDIILEEVKHPVASGNAADNVQVKKEPEVAPAAGESVETASEENNADSESIPTASPRSSDTEDSTRSVAQKEENKPKPVGDANEKANGARPMMVMPEPFLRGIFDPIHKLFESSAAKVDKKPSQGSVTEGKQEVVNASAETANGGQPGDDTPATLKTSGTELALPQERLATKPFASRKVYFADKSKPIIDPKTNKPVAKKAPKKIFANNDTAFVVSTGGLAYVSAEQKTNDSKPIPQENIDINKQNT